MTTSITVTYNSSDVLAGLVESAAAQLDEMIIVDNDSSDGTLERVRTLVDTYPNVTLIRNGTNVGFAGAVNRGLAVASGDVVLLNPDVRVPEGAIASLQAESERLGSRYIVAPRLRYLTGQLQESARTFPSLGPVLARRTPLRFTSWGRRQLATHQSHSTDEPVFVDWAIGAALFVPSTLRPTVGPMPEEYFLYCEDVDWCTRAWRNGSGVVYLPAVELTHLYARASKRTLDFMNRTTRLHWTSFIRLVRNYPGEFWLARRTYSRHGDLAC